MENKLENVITNLIPTSDNINSQLKSATKISKSLDKMTVIMNGVVDNINRIIEISDKIDSKDYINASQKLISVYIKGLSNIIDPLINIKDKDILFLLDRFEEVEIKDDKITKKSGDIKILVAIKTINDIISIISKGFETISNMDTGIKSTIKLKVGISILGDNIKELMNMLSETFADLSKSDDVKNLINSLVSEPALIDKIENLNFDKDGKIISKSVSEKVVKEGHVGIVDAIAAVFGLAESINNFKIPEFLTFKLKFLIFKLEMESLIENILNICCLTNSLTEKGKTIKYKDSAGKNRNAKFSGSPLESLSTFCEQFEEIMDSFVSFSKSLSIIGLLALPMLLGILGLRVFVKALNEVEKIIVESEKITIDEDVIVKFSSIANIMESIMKTSLYLSAMAILGIPAVLGGAITIIVVIMLRGIVSVIGSKEFSETLENGSKNLKNLSIALLILSGVLVLLTIVGVIISTKFLLLIAPFIALIVICVALKLFAIIFSSIKEEVSKNVIMLSVIVIILSVSLIFLALAGVIIKENIGALFAVVFSLVIIVAVVVAISYVSANIFIGVGALLVLGIAMIAISTSLIILVIAAKLWAKQGLKGIGIIMCVVMTFIALAALAVFAITGVGALLVLGAAMVTVSAGLIILSFAAKIWADQGLDGIENIKYVVKAFIKLAALAVFAVIGAPALIILSVAMIFVSGALVVVKGAASIISKEECVEIVYKLNTLFFGTGKKDENGRKNKGILGIFKKLGNPITLIALTLGTIGLAIMLADSVLLLGVVGCLVGVSKLSKQIEDSGGLDKKRVENGIINPLNEIIAGINGLNIARIFKASVIMGMVGSNIARPVGKMVRIINDLANMKVVEYDKNGKVIRYRQITEKDFELAKQGVIKIVEAMCGAINNEDIKNISIDQAKNSKKVLKQLSQISSPISSLVETIKNLADGKVKDYDENTGKILGEISLINFISSHETNIKETIKNTLTIFANAIIGAFGDKDVRKTIAKSEDAAIALQPLTESIHNMIESIKSLSEKKIDITGASSYIESIVKTYVGLFVPSNGSTPIFSDDSIKKLSNDETKKAIENIGIISKYVNEIGNSEKFNLKNNTQAANNFATIITKANSIDSDKIKSVSEMFKQIASFSSSINGNFDRLADILSEKLVIVLEKLHGVIIDMKDTNININTQTSQKFGESDTEQKERVKMQESAQVQNTIDLSGVELALEEIQQLVEEIKNRGVRVQKND